MSNVFAPFGLRPALHISGIVRPWSGTIVSGLAQNIYQNAPVIISNAAGAGSGCLEVAPAAGRAIGTFQGVEYTLTATGRRTVANWWASGIVATDIVAYYTRDAWVTYEIQANGPINQVDVGNQANWTLNDGSAGTGNQVTGLSTVALDTATLVSGSGGAGDVKGLRIIGFSPYIGNGPANLDPANELFTIVLVEISQHQNVANQQAYGG